MSHAWQVLLVDPWPAWAGGLAIGAYVLLFLFLTGRQLGVSTGYEDACGVLTQVEARRSWRLPLLVGMIAGGALAGWLSGEGAAGWSMGRYDALAPGLGAKALLFGGGGLLVGFGARLAGGCTSGHGIVGLALRAPSSIIATTSFVVGGVVVVHLLFAVWGG